MKILISMVSYNTQNLLEKLLTKILSQKSQNEVFICVLDNASTDDSVKMLEKSFKNVKLIKSDKNLGFAGGQNRILKSQKFELALIVNPDCEFKMEDVDKMVEYFKIHQNVGVAASKIIYPDGRLQPNAGDLPLGVALISWLYNLEILGDLPNFHRTENGYYKKGGVVGWVAGTFMVVRKDVLEKIGYFDDRYFMYFEDVDLCFRASKIGYKIMLNPQVTIKHISGASSKDPKFNQWLGEMKGLLYFYRKNFGALSSGIVKLIVYKAIILRMIVLALIGKLRDFGTYKKIIYQI